MTWLSKVFALDRSGLNWARGVMFLDVALVPLVVFWAIGHEQYLLSAIFGALFAVLADPGGPYGPRVARMGTFAVVGAGVTAAAFALGGSAWGWLALAAFGITLLAGLAVALGVHRFVAALILNIWFIVALGLSVSLHQRTHITSYTWAQVVAWVGGSALWIVVTFAAWLISGRRDAPQPVAELPGDTSTRRLSTPLIAFAVIRGLAVAGSVAIAFGFTLAHGAWLPIATIVALKPDLGQSTLIAVQRIAGALIGAVTAGLILLVPAGEHGLRLFTVDRVLEVVAIVLFMHAAAIRFWNYAMYAAAVAAAVLIMEDLTQPSDYSAEGYRVLWTLAGVAIGVLVMGLAELMAKRAKRKAQPAPA